MKKLTIYKVIEVDECELEDGNYCPSVEVFTDIESAKNYYLDRIRDIGEVFEIEDIGGVLQGIKDNLETNLLEDGEDSCQPCPIKHLFIQKDETLLSPDT